MSTHLPMAIGRASGARHNAPVAVGGVGGSGTRVVAEMLRAAGVYTGDHLTRASDTLWFTLLFKRSEVLVADDAEFDLLTSTLAAALRGGTPLSPEQMGHLQLLSGSPRPHHPVEQLRASAESMAAAAMRPAADVRWGWKEPNTHVVIERIWQRLPELRYVHVVRNGLDMAFSTNQHQLRLWGRHVLGADGPATPARSLAYWCEVHRRLQRLHADHADRMYWLDFDALCLDPHRGVAGLLEFLGLEDSTVDVGALGIVPQPPKHTRESLRGLSSDDVAYVHALGYRTP